MKTCAEKRYCSECNAPINAKPAGSGKAKGRDLIALGLGDRAFELSCCRG